MLRRIEFVAFITYAATILHSTSRRADVALRPSVNVVFSLQKGDWEKEARERKGTNEASDGELRKRTRIETSYRYESATGCHPARLRASRMFLFIPPFLFLALLSRFSRSPPRAHAQYLFSSVTSVPASRFTSVISYLDTRRNVSGGSVDEDAVNGFYSVSNWKPIGCRHCHKIRREIDVYRWSIRFIIC